MACQRSIFWLSAPPPPTGSAARDLDGSEIVGTDLERWILAQCAANGALPAGANSPAIVYAPTTAPAPPYLTIPQLLTLVRSLQELIGAARPVTPADFVPPAATFPATDLDLSGVATRLATAADALLTLNATLAGLVASLAASGLSSADGDTLSKALMTAASFGFPGAPPATLGRDPASLAALLSQATTVSAAVALRVSTSTTNSSIYDLNTNNLALAASATNRTLKLAQDTAEAIFGPQFMILPVVSPTTAGTNPDPVATAVGNLTAGLAAWGPEGRLPAAAVLGELTHVRPPIARLDEVLSLSAVLSGLPVADFAVAQLSGQQRDSTSNPWLGTGPTNTPFPPPVSTSPPLQGSYALLVWTPTTLGASTGPSLCGLFFDEWIEQIPNSAEKPAITFHYDEPGARAPQSRSLAVTPPNTEWWSAALLRDTVLEAVALAKILGPLIPKRWKRVVRSVGPRPALFAGLGPFTISTMISNLPTSSVPAGA